MKNERNVDRTLPLPGFGLSSSHGARGITDTQQSASFVTAMQFSVQQTAVRNKTMYSHDGFPAACTIFKYHKGEHRMNVSPVGTCC